MKFADGRRASEAPTTLFRAPDGIFALSGGRQSFIALVNPLDGPPAGALEESGEILAPMHGRLIALNVAEGDAVEEGQRLAVVEAMKMEHALLAPRSGRIVGLSIAVGDTVEQGQRLMAVREGEA